MRWLLLSVAVRTACAITALAGDGTTKAARTATTYSRVAEGEAAARDQKSEIGVAVPPCAPRSLAPLPMPPVEDLRNWRAHPDRRWEFSDRVLAVRVDRWAREVAA